MRKALVIYLVVVALATATLVVYAQQTQPSVDPTPRPMRAHIELRNVDGHLRTDVRAGEEDQTFFGADGRTYRVRIEKRKFQR